MNEYRGIDRRGTISADSTPWWWLALAVAALAAGVAADVGGAGADHAAAIGGTAAGVALGCAGVAALRWWEVGDAACLWLTAGLLPTAAALAAPEAVGHAGHLAGAVAVLGASVVPDVDARLRRWWLAAVPAAVTAPLTVLAIPDWLVVAGWLVAAAALLARGLRADRALLSWSAAGAGGLALAMGPAGPITALFAVTVVLVALLRGVRGAILSQRERLLSAAIDSRHALARSEAGAYARERLAHDAQNSLTALTGAALTLERHRARLDESTRETLTAGMRKELDRLHELIGQEDTDTPKRFRVMSALRPLRAEPDAPDEWDIPEELTAFGRIGDTGQVVRLLLAHRHGQLPITVRAGVQGEQVHIDVSGVWLDGLNLRVAAALMQAQGGELQAVHAPPGYLLRLPLADSG